MCEISSQYHKGCISYEQITLPAKFGVTHCTLSVEKFIYKLQINSFLYQLKGITESGLCTNMFTGPVDIYEVKRALRHLLVGIQNN